MNNSEQSPILTSSRALTSIFIGCCSLSAFSKCDRDDLSSKWVERERKLSRHTPAPRGEAGRETAQRSILSNSAKQLVLVLVLEVSLEVPLAVRANGTSTGYRPMRLLGIGRRTGLARVVGFGGTDQVVCTQGLGCRVAPNRTARNRTGPVPR